jgi:hypothetical protein
MMRYEVINPHDKITIDCTNIPAAQLAVIYVGRGGYGIDDGDGKNILPILLFGGHEKWAQENYGMSFEEWQDTVRPEDMATALESMRLEHERSSSSDPVGNAHEMARRIRAKLAEGK